MNIIWGMMRLKDDQDAFDAKLLLRKIESVLDLGITTIDHADIYGDYECESIFGEALKLNSKIRNRMRLITKCGIKLVSPNRPDHTIKYYDYSAKHITESVDRSLQNLKTDFIDLLLLHRPSPLLDPDEVAETFAALKKSGKVKEFGVSNFSVSQVEMLNARVNLTANQVEVNPLRLDTFMDGTLDQCIRLGMTPMAWSPLAGGQILSATDARTARVKSELESLGEKYGASIDTLVYAWLLKHPSRMQIVVGTGKLDRLASAAEAQDLKLDAQDWFRIWRASIDAEVP